jgi:serine/threonine protein phosphatase PrpC
MIKQEEKHNLWLLTGDSVIGKIHVRSHLPNQDSIRFNESHDGCVPIIVALADGHGSSKCFRSALGSSLATKIAIEVLAEFFKATENLPLPNSSALITADRLLKNEVPTSISRKWSEEVGRQTESDPFTDEELNRLSQKDLLYVKDHPAIAYGTTLLAVLVTNHYVAYIQIGDGEILTVSDSGEIDRPIPTDERLSGNETTSLAGYVRSGDRIKSPISSTQAHIDFRIRLVPFARNTPRLILLTTDGYPNSFRSNEDFLKVGTDILSMINYAGFDAVSNEIPVWLSEASSVGSGDDVTLGLIYRRDIQITPENSAITQSDASKVKNLPSRFFEMILSRIQSHNNEANHINRTDLS